MKNSTSRGGSRIRARALTPLRVERTAAFRRQLRGLCQRGAYMGALERVVGPLRRREVLPARYRDHVCADTRRRLRDCHVTPDWVLLYRVDESRQVLLLVGTGTHSDLRLRERSNLRHIRWKGVT